MITYFDKKSNDNVAIRLAEDMVRTGFPREDAERLGDAAASISLAILREMDEKIIASSENENERTAIQQAVFLVLINQMREGMKTNMINGLIKAIGL
jgi:hypothetical protein